MKIVLKDQDTPHDQTLSEFSLSQAHSLQRSNVDKRIPVLDGVRAIACLSVIVFHVSLLTSKNHVWTFPYNIHDVPGMLAYSAGALGYAGDSGVILFFLLSGFLLFLPYAKALLFESAWPSLRRFYLRRFFRILPGYYVVLFLMILFLHPWFLHARYWHDLWLFLTFRMTFSLSGELNPPFWTLAVEFQFYLLLPIITWLFGLIVRRGPLHWRMLKLTLCLLGTIAWGLLTRYWGIYIANTPKLDFLIPHTLSQALLPFIYSDHGKYFEVFAIGMLVAMIYTYTQNSPWAELWYIRMRRLSPLLFTTSLVLLSFLSFWYFYTEDTNSLPRSSKPQSVFTFLNPDIASIVVRHWAEWQALAYAIGYGLCMLALLYGSARLKRPFESSLLRWIASISFSLYMWHFNFISLFAAVFLPHMQRLGWSPPAQYAAFWCWTLLVIIPTSAMLYRWVEQPGMHLGEWLIRKFAR